MHQKYVEVIDGEVVDVSTPLAGGVLEIVEGIGFLRGETLLPSPDDIYVSQTQIHRFNLRTGQMVFGQVRPPRRHQGETHFSLMHIESVNDLDPEIARQLPRFEDLTAIEPDPVIDLSQAEEIEPRLIDMYAPIRRGDGDLLVAPRKAGKTTILIKMLQALAELHPDIYLMAILVGERKHEVTRYQRETSAQIFGAALDATVNAQVQVAKLGLEHAKTLAAAGQDVFVAMDGITRLARAYNLVAPVTGGYLSGGVNPAVVHGPESPKGRFATYGNLEGAGSVTVFATCLEETGSRMDDLIYEEMEGTGTSAFVLDLKLAEAEVFPAINFARSSTRLTWAQRQQRWEIEAWKAVIDICLEMSNWGGHPNNRRRALHQLMYEHRDWGDVGVGMVQKVLERHPGQFQPLMARLAEKPEALQVLTAKLQPKNDEERWTFEALARVPELLEKEKAES